MIKKVDYIIVGQGISGTFMAYQLLKKGKKLLVIDKGFKNSSSWVAAGVVNPLVLKRLTITWRAKEFLQYNDSFYSSLEQFLGGRYFHPTPLKKLIYSKEEKEFWKHRYEKAELKTYIERDLNNTEPSQLSFKKNFHLGHVKQTAWVDIKALLFDFRNYLKSKNLIIEESFDFNQLEYNNYKDFSFNKAIFCEGSKAAKNPYFNTLPFSFNKGELITLKSNNIKTQDILKKKVFILPTGNHLFKVGATYSWSWDNEKPTEEKKIELINSFKEILSSDFEINNHEAGIRPAVKDRRPLLGKHDEKPYYIFNGMGSRACFISPLLSSEMVDFIEQGKSLHPESDISRFKPS